ncbi:MAG: peptidase and DD-carboxypeptidase VanY/endolysin [Parcubacteria group bacterium]|nr:peptidase and DD-carboxypeptidase VanY/endolysin [Parcubacteria group bacterium]
MDKRFYIPIAAIVILVVYGGYRYTSLVKVKNATQLELASTTVALEGKTKTLVEAQNNNLDLLAKLEGELSRNNAFEQQLNSISSTVGLLDKLSKTDKELLQKYSKVYFLNENFVPSALSDIDASNLFRKDKPEKIHTSVLPYLNRLLAAASQESIPISVLSAYRSFGTQTTLKAAYKVTYGAGTANKFSADQGYSEHQLGSALDFTTPTAGVTLTNFDKTSAYDWLTKNAYKYGFILSYPKGNTFYQYEPWHWRFVGVELATKLHADNLSFYNMDQREINKYLVKIFD